ncbi:hypothetical protein HZS_6615 [Henneguya salminicola]|nr:hypothetical protein HZS_6615 [Henneguya salminicola]
MFLTKRSSRRGRKPNKSIRVDSHLNQEAVSLNSKKPSSPDSSMENNTKFNAVVTTENVILTENQHNISQKKNKSEQQRSWYFPSQMTDLLFKNKTAFSHLDNTISDTSNHNLTTHRRTQVPIKLALRRGLYHLIPNQFLSDNYQQNLNKSETTIISDVSLNNRKRQFNERENIKKNNILPTATVINTQEPPKIKKELPIPELRPTLPSTKNIISNNNNIFQ